MKNKKWLTYTLGTLLTLGVLAGVAAVSYRIGLSQNPSFTRPAFAQNFNGMPRFMPRNAPDNDNSQGMPRNFRGQNFRDQGFRGQAFDAHRFNRNNRMPFFSPVIFGLIHLVLAGLVIVGLGWLVYILVKRSGWRLMRVPEPSPAPLEASETDEAKETNNKKKKAPK